MFPLEDMSGVKSFSDVNEVHDIVNNWFRTTKSRHLVDKYIPKDLSKVIFVFSKIEFKWDKTALLGGFKLNDDDQLANVKHMKSFTIQSIYITCEKNLSLDENAHTYLSWRISKLMEIFVHIVLVLLKVARVVKHVDSVVFA